MDRRFAREGSGSVPEEMEIELEAGE